MSSQQWILSDKKLEGNLKTLLNQPIATIKTENNKLIEIDVFELLNELFARCLNLIQSTNYTNILFNIYCLVNNKNLESISDLNILEQIYYTNSIESKEVFQCFNKFYNEITTLEISNQSKNIIKSLYPKDLTKDHLKYSVIQLKFSNYLFELINSIWTCNITLKLLKCRLDGIKFKETNMGRSLKPKGTILYNERVFRYIDICTSKDSILLDATCHLDKSILKLISNYEIFWGIIKNMNHYTSFTKSFEKTKEIYKILQDFIERIPNLK
jgi:hypothetical protein